MTDAMGRRRFLELGGMALAAGLAASARGDDSKPDAAKKTEFQIACMTLPYSRFPLARALEGIRWLWR